MTRIDELQTKYPSIHKDIIVKWVIEANGILDTKDLDVISDWRRGGDLLYVSEEGDLTVQRMKEETPWRIRDGAMLLPNRLTGKTGFGFAPRRTEPERTSYTIREIGEGKVALFEGEEMVDHELFPYRPPKIQMKPGWVTSRGRHISELGILDSPTSLFVIPSQFCEYFNTGEECKFCNYNQTFKDGQAAGLARDVMLNADEVGEAIKIYGSEVRIRDGRIVSGTFKKGETNTNVNLRFVERIVGALPYDIYLRHCTEPISRKNLQRLKDAGLSSIRYQMETFDRRLFPVMLPGKAAHLSRDGWLEAFEEAVEVFGAGNVAAKFVGGLTLQGPDGYATWQEARDSHMEGDRWMISHGVYPAMCVLRWAPGSPFSRDPANRTRFAPTEYFLDLALAHHAAMKEFGLYEKMNKQIYFYPGNISSVLYCMDLDIIEMAGDVGKWWSDVIPYEENYAAQLIDSIRSGKITTGSTPANESSGC